MMNLVRAVLLQWHLAMDSDIVSFHMAITPLLKPKNMKRRRKYFVLIKADGREICLTSSSKLARKEYRARVMLMFDRQKGTCRWCALPMSEEESTFDHDNGRTKGNQDDRIEADGVEQNAAVHCACNTERGSIRHLTREAWMKSKTNGKGIMKIASLVLMATLTAAGTAQNHKSPTPKIKTTSTKNADGTYNTETTAKCPKGWQVYMSPASVDIYNAERTPEAMIVLLSQAICVEKFEIK